MSGVDERSPKPPPLPGTRKRQATRSLRTEVAVIDDPAIDRVLARSPFGQTHADLSPLLSPHEHATMATAAASSTPRGLEVMSPLAASGGVEGVVQKLVCEHVVLAPHMGVG